MMSKTFFLMSALMQIITSQRLPPYNYPQVYPEMIERFSPPQYPPMAPAENDIMCKSLASAIQNAIFDRFSQSCIRKPIFGPMSAPLVNEIKNSLCNCPMCSTVNISPNGYSKSYVSSNSVSNMLKSVPSPISNTCPNTISSVFPRSQPSVGISPRVNPNVGVNRKYSDLLAMIGGYPSCDCGCRGPIGV